MLLPLSGCIIVTNGDGDESDSGEASASATSAEGGDASSGSSAGDGDSTGETDSEGDGDSTGDGDSAGDGDSSGDGDSAGDGDGDDAQALCESTEGTWDPTTCDHYNCGVENDCEAVIPGCNCGPAANFAEGVGCVPDKTCGSGLGDGEVCDPGNDLCGPGLACCYPCGIPDCDWQCQPEVSGPDGPCGPPPP